MMTSSLLLKYPSYFSLSNFAQDISVAFYLNPSVKFKTIKLKGHSDHARPWAAYTRLFIRFLHVFGLISCLLIEISCHLFLEDNLTFRKLLQAVETMDHLIFIWLLLQLIILRKEFVIFLKELRVEILLKWDCIISLLFSFFLELIFLSQFLKELLLLFFMI